MIPTSSRSILLAFSLVLAGCSTPSTGSVPNPTVTAGSTPPATTAAQPAASGAALVNAHISQLSVSPGQPASFNTAAGRNLTVVASAAQAGTLAPSLKLTVGAADVATVASTVTAGYKLASLDDYAREAPYRSTLTATNQAMAGRSKGHGARRKLLADSPPPALGSSAQFWISNGDSAGPVDVQETCTLQRITDHALIWQDAKGVQFSKDQLDQLAAQFESNVYPREAAVFGTPPVPNLDGQDRVHIVVSPAVDNFGSEKGLLGYFWSRDALPNGDGGPHSNQKYVLFMSDQLFTYPALTSFGTMAHEYQHLLNFAHKAVNTNYAVAEETWLDEGMAMYAMEVAGYGLPAGDPFIAKDLNEFQQDPIAYSLTDWDNNPHHFSYGQNYLFVRYLANRYGPTTMKEIYASQKTGVDCIEEVLNKHGDTFANFFSAWAIANLVSGSDLAKGTVYNYPGLDIAGQFGDFKLQGIKTTPVSDPDAQISLRVWGSAYLGYASTSNQAWKINLTDPSGTRLMGAAVVP